MRLALTQSWAMLVDSYRELNARKMFWITLVISLLVAGALACLGINDKGLTFLWYQVPIQDLAFVNTSQVEPGAFYKFLFLSFGFSIWLTWAATILALVSTASIIPDFVSSGSVELTLSKPIGRLRLFVTKYVTALLYSALQTAVFTTAAFMVIGLRGGSWEFGLFWAVPLVTLFFSFLFCVMALVGMLTRSAVTSVLVTGVVWFMIFALHVTELALLSSKIVHQVAVEEQASQIVRTDNEILKIEGELSGVAARPVGTPAAGETTADDDKADGGEGMGEGGGERPAPAAKKPTQPWAGMSELATTEQQRRDRLANLRSERERLTGQQAETRETLTNLTKYHALFFGVKTILPKTAETMGLLERRLFSGQEFERLRENQAEAGRSGRTTINGTRVSMAKVSKRQEEQLRSRSVGWILGTSMAFQAAVLGLACLLFVRKDF